MIDEQRKAMWRMLCSWRMHVVGQCDIIVGMFGGFHVIYALLYVRYLGLKSFIETHFGR